MNHKVKEFHQHNRRVSDQDQHNEALPDKDRLSNLEHDATAQWDILRMLVEQNNNYAAYVKVKKEAEAENRKFWREQRGKIVTAGILGSLGIIGTAGWFAFTHWVKTL